jgi:O-antigen ligase
MTILPFIAALAWGFVAWRNPRFAVLALPAFLPVYLWRTHLGPLPTTALELLFAATAVGATLKLGLGPWQNGWRKISGWRWPAVAWLIATFIAVWIAPDHIPALGLWRAYVLEPLAYFVLLNAFLKNAADRRFVVLSLALPVFAIAAWSIFQYSTGLGIPHPWGTDILTRRATGPFPFPNAVSLFCAPLAALFLGLALTPAPSSQSPIPKTLLWLAFFSATLATLLAKSVGGALGILAAATTLLVIRRPTRYWTLAGIALGILVILAVPQLRAPTIKTLSFDGWSGRVRVWMWQETWQMLKDRPIQGAGLGAYPQVFKPYHEKTFIEIFQYPHNIVLNLWSETGLLGLLAFAWIVLTWLKASLRSQLPAPSPQLLPLLPLIAILVQGLVDVPYFKNDLAFAFWIFAALAVNHNVSPKAEHPPKTPNAIES